MNRADCFRVSVAGSDRYVHCIADDELAATPAFLLVWVTFNITLSNCKICSLGFLNLETGLFSAVTKNWILDIIENLKNAMLTVFRDRAYFQESCLRGTSRRDQDFNAAYLAYLPLPPMEVHMSSYKRCPEQAGHVCAVLSILNLVKAKLLPEQV